MSDAAPSADLKSVPTGEESSNVLQRRGRHISLVALGLMLALLLSEQMPFQPRVRAFLFDSYQAIAPRPRVSAPAMIVDIDETSLHTYGQWPWPRSLLAQLIERVATMGPAAIGVDILMPEPDRASPCAAARYVPEMTPLLVNALCALPSNDALLAKALRDARAVLSVAGVDRATEVSLLAPPMLAVGGDPVPLLRRFAGALTSLSELHAAAAGHAIVSADTELGILRWVPIAAGVGSTVMPSLPVEMLRLASQSPGFMVKSVAGRISGVGVGDLFVPTQADGRLWVHYGHYRPDRYVSASAVLDGQVAPALLKNRLVLIGVSGLGLVDFPMTALGERVPGVEIHAQVLESIFDGTTLLRPQWAGWGEAAVLLCLGLALVFAIACTNSMLAMLIAFMSGIVLLGIGFWLFVSKQILFDAATPALLLTLLFGGMLTYELMREQINRRRLAESLRLQREAAARTAGEMAAARRIQLGMVPDAKATFAADSRIDIAARMAPAREVGGDLYDCFMLDEHRAFFLVGDVCGKGIAASLFMAISKTLCKSVALRSGMELDQLMRAANMEIARENSQMLFVTAFAGIVDLRSGELWYANAGHERPFAAAAGRSPVSLDGPGGPPLGIMESIDYRVSRYALSSDEFLCVVTDGVSEATDPANNFFGKERLKATLTGIAQGDDADAVLDTIFKQVIDFGGGSERSDDVTVMVLRWCGPG